MRFRSLGRGPKKVSRLDLLPDESALLRFITDCLTPLELLEFGTINTRWARFARGPDVWRQRVAEICGNKAYVPLPSLLGIEDNPKKSEFEDAPIDDDPYRSPKKSPLKPDFESSDGSPRMYFTFLQDSRRTWFHDAEELGSLHFHFRYKAVVGPQITDLDPSHTGEGFPMYRRFYPNGLMSIYPDEEADLHPYAVGTAGPDPFGAEVDHLRWKFGGQKVQHVKVGHYPPLRIARHPEDWGFILESDWMVFRTCCEDTVTLDEKWTSVRQSVPQRRPFGSNAASPGRNAPPPPRGYPGGGQRHDRADRWSPQRDRFRDNLGGPLTF